MKIFLSSPIEGLREARQSMEDLQKLCEGSVEIVTYDNGNYLHHDLTPEDTCLELVRGCEALLLLLDQVYGAPYSKNQDISITHAEVLEAEKYKLKIIPVIRTQTFHEFLVWKNNKDLPIQYHHVRQVKLFLLLEKLCSERNCQFIENFSSSECLEKISKRVLEIQKKDSIGSLENLLLPEEKPVINTNNEYPIFESGKVLRSEQLNELYNAISSKAKSHGLDIIPKITWLNGTTLCSSDLNLMLDDIGLIYKKSGRDIPCWSFKKFEDHQILRSKQLNEIIEKLKSI